ncbi:MAG: SdpI family protein [Ignavibacteriales bacterium]|nr:MAG: SdpI family protein [Ignavibacteriales bacterium]
MSSQEVWDFAQKYSSRVMLFSGVILIVIGVIALPFPVINPLPEVIISVFIVIASVIALYFLTEQEIKNRFPK